MPPLSLSLSLARSLSLSSLLFFPCLLSGMTSSCADWWTTNLYSVEITGFVKSEGKGRVMWNVNRKTLISILNSDSKCGSFNLSVCVHVSLLVRVRDEDFDRWMCFCGLPPFTSLGALRCPASHRWGLVALKMNVLKQEAAFTSAGQAHHLSALSYWLVNVFFLSYRLCLSGLVSCWLQGQPNQVAIGSAAGVQFLHLVAYFIDLWLWWLAAYQCRVITIGQCEVE